MGEAAGTPAGARAAIGEALRGETPIWFPGLGEVLATATWPLLTRDVGLSEADYSTARMRTGDATFPRTIDREILAPSAFRRAKPIFFETLPNSLAARYEDLGLDLATSAVAGSNDVAQKVGAALARLAHIDSIADTIGQMLHVVHIAVPDGPDFDVSYSDPEVPFSIWVGVFRQETAIGDLRLAEGILHESMHLQLSLLEHFVPLLSSNKKSMHSPWRNGDRPVQGVLHGAYVFSVIREFFLALREADAVSREEAPYVCSRIETCALEVSSVISSLVETPDLTKEGGMFVARLLSRLQS